MCRVLNKRKSGIPAGAIYTGRGSKWGNLFRIGLTATVQPSSQSMSAGCAISIICCVDLTICADDLLSCAPLACHGDLLLWLANASREDRIAWWCGQIDHRAWRCG